MAKHILIRIQYTETDDDLNYAPEHVSLVNGYMFGVERMLVVPRNL